MELLIIALLMLAAALLATFIVRLLPWPLPVPLVQVALGSLIGSMTNWHVALDPDVFFLLFLPPLLFRDSWRVPKDAILKDRNAILGLALGLVVLTMGCVGYLIHWLFPNLPLPIAFALAAVLSPTDPIAVPALASRLSLPDRLVHILEGEALLNDASGLVCFRLAVAAALSGGVSLADATTGFLWVTGCGIVVGTAVTWAVVKARAAFGRVEADTQVTVIMTWLIPIGSHLAAEHLHCSGIMAAVAAGVTMGAMERSCGIGSTDRTHLNAVWNTLQVAANGVVFVLMGEQLPSLASGAFASWNSSEHGSAWLFPFAVLAIAGGLVGVRYVWVWSALQVTLWWGARHQDPMRHPGWPMLAAISLAGTRGAVTLAGVMTLPGTLQGGAPFPGRDLAILLASAVIIVSLAGASFGLPWLLNGRILPQEPSRDGEEEHARLLAARSAMHDVRQAGSQWAVQGQPALHEAAVMRILAHYLVRIEERSDGSGTAQQEEIIERRLIAIALQAERSVLVQEARGGRLSFGAAGRLLNELDLLEEAIVPGSAAPV